jgi:hypothetical protein
MSNWAPLANLRSEVAAAKVSPPIAAAPNSARRRTPTVQAVSKESLGAGGAAGWGWVVGGVSLGALVGLLTAQFFPKIVERNVDRPVEVIRTVDRPVEVIRTVEKKVEVPAALTESQVSAIRFAEAMEDAFKRDVGIGASSIVPVFDKKVKVYIESQADKSAVSPASIRARVETVLRRNGFTVVPEGDDEFVGTLIIASLDCLDRSDSDQITGSINLSVSQYGLFAGGQIQKRAWVTMVRHGMSIQYGKNNFYKIPQLFDDFAVEVSNDLMKAGKLPYSK